MITIKDDARTDLENAFHTKIQYCSVRARLIACETIDDVIYVSLEQGIAVDNEPIFRKCRAPFDKKAALPCIQNTIVEVQIELRTPFYVVQRILSIYPLNERAAAKYTAIAKKIDFSYF